MKKSLTLLVGLISLFSLVSSSCSYKTGPHNGTFPFFNMEKPLSQRSAQKKAGTKSLVKLEKVLSYTPKQASDFSQISGTLQAGDLIAFYMPHSEARKHLKQFAIQKIPYELFSYGHLALLTPCHETDKVSSELRLLQVAMKQRANADSTMNYLKDKNWIAYRPPVGSINNDKLHEFTQHVCANEKSAYSYIATLGLINGNTTPQSTSEFEDKYTCTTLVIAALHHSGLQLHTPRRNGFLDIITPRQVVDSWGCVILPK